MIKISKMKILNMEKIYDDTVINGKSVVTVRKIQDT